MRKALLFFTSVLLIQSCSQSLDGGTIEKTFEGISAATVLGPQTVEINWSTNSNCNKYEIYRLSSSSTSAVAEAALPPVRLTTPTIIDSQAYTFAVGCSGSSGITGQDVILSANTWSKFGGVVTSKIDTTGQKNVLVFDWNFLPNTGTVFSLYAKESTVPGDLSNWQLTSLGSGLGYSETPICTTFDQEIRIGDGGSCSPTLKSGVTYNFKIVAQYPDKVFSNDILGNGVSQTVPASFTPPLCFLTPTGLGDSSSSTYLYLRCGAYTGATCASVTTQAFQTVGSTRNIVSDVLSNEGVLRIQPALQSSTTNSRVVSGLEIDYTCHYADGTSSLAVVSYDNNIIHGPNGDFSNKMPMLKYGNSNYVAAPVQGYGFGQNPSLVGQSFAIGDFNCDGSPDIAIGLPDITFNSAPYYNKNPGSGAVKVVYDYAVDNNGDYYSTTGNIQYLTFRDLPAGAGFGRSLSAGNINKDYHTDPKSQNNFSCDDLIIGAAGYNGTTSLTNPNPGYGNTGGGFSGAAFIFFGQPQKFPQPLDYASLSLNAPTCSGTLSSEICSVVRLTPDSTRWLKVSSNYSTSSTATNSAAGGQFNAGYSYSSFGFKVAYIRDFNADGYGDIAISDPFCDWDGEVTNGYAHPFLSTIPQVGCVYVYWGGPFGIANVIMGKTPDEYVGTPSTLNSPFAKIFPPFPQANMHFGWSIAGGGDVDSRPPVPISMYGGSNLILANGNDFVVSAPHYKYNTTDSNQGKYTGALTAWSFTADGVDPYVKDHSADISFTDSSATIPSIKMVPPLNGAWTQDPSAWKNTDGPPVPSNTKLQASTGIVFLYKGRAPLTGYEVAVNDGFNKYPNQVVGGFTTSMSDALSSSMGDRTNGSQYLTLSTSSPPASWKLAPVESFYNCGPRGAPTRPDGNGTFKHNSCFAGRNNFSVIYPALKTTDNSVTYFGSQLKIAGANEQNAVALYELGSFDQSGFRSAYSKFTHTDTAKTDLVPLAMGNIHDRIRGTNLWELGIPGLNSPGAVDTCSKYTTSGNSTAASCTANSGILSRSAINESYNFGTSTGFTGITPNAKPLTDINQDGYADIIVTTNEGKVFTYYGNYAADFSYQGDNNSAAPCNVTRLTTTPGVFATTLPGATTLLASGNNTGIKPFTTYHTYASVITTGNSSITSEFPETYIPQKGNFSQLASLDDALTGDSTSISFSYLTPSRGVGSLSATAALNCSPYVQDFSLPITSIDTADMDNDGMIDVILGISSDTANTGKAMISFSSGSSYPFIVNSSNSKNGSAVAASNWSFFGTATTPDTSRRDLFTGAVGYMNGSGSIYNYHAPQSNPLSNMSPTQILENSNYPNSLKVELSKVIGDVNGDGYDDILVPVKQVSVTGSVYYDALIYFGSPFGPVTYEFCVANGFAISDCKGSASSILTTLNGTSIHLPQYLSSPTGVSSTWALHALAAGDVNGDGFSDVLVMDYDLHSIYLFAGSSSGVVNGSPQFGPMNTNLTPQLVTQNSNITNLSSWIDGTSQPINSWNHIASSVSIQNYPIVHGDFNGDGYQDLALTISLRAPVSIHDWDCSGAQEAYPNTAGGPCSVQNYTTDGQRAGSPGGNYAVIVIYGGANAYQTPMNGSTPVAFDPDFTTIPACGNFYAGCLNISGHLPKMQEAYNTLKMDVNFTWTLDSTKTACDPSTKACKGQIIRNPVFYNLGKANNTDTWEYMGKQGPMGAGFGTMLSVADTNYDGVDDLLIADPSYYLPGSTNLSPVPNTTGGGNDSYQGRVYIFYGAKDVGIVAPDASQVVGDVGLGIGTDGKAIPGLPPFALYPKTNAAGTDQPELEKANGTFGASRQFGMNMSVGDFNGDGYDDIAITSAAGQLYIVYGPICQFDNESATWGNTYKLANHNIAQVMDAPAITALVNCKGFNFNTGTPYANITSNAINVGAMSGKSNSLYPQMVYMAGTTTNNNFGSMMLSKRPMRSPASTTIISRPGNIDNDDGLTSDLVIGSASMQDPNVNSPSGSNTGLAYIFFGHQNFNGNTGMPTTPGLYIGNPSYNSSIVPKNVPGSNCPGVNFTCYYHQPMFVKAYTPDGLTGKFFLYETGMGDLNGDGTADLVVPTFDYGYGADGTTAVVNGGALKLIY